MTAASRHRGRLTTWARASVRTGRRAPPRSAPQRPAARPRDRLLGTRKSLASRGPVKAARSTLANTCADAFAAGVFSAAMHSGSHSRRATRGGSADSIWSTVSPRGRARGGALELSKPRELARRSCQDKPRANNSPASRPSRPGRAARQATTHRLARREGREREGQAERPRSARAEDPRDQCERARVGAQQQVLAVVEQRRRVFDAARAPARHAVGLEDGDARTPARGRAPPPRRGPHSRRADDADARAQRPSTDVRSTRSRACAAA